MPYHSQLHVPDEEYLILDHRGIIQETTIMPCLFGIPHHSFTLTALVDDQKKFNFLIIFLSTALCCSMIPLDHGASAAVDFIVILNCPQISQRSSLLNSPPLSETITLWAAKIAIQFLIIASAISSIFNICFLPLWQHCILLHDLLGATCMFCLFLSNQLLP